MTSVLVADDDRDIRELISFKLQAAGYDVVTASDGDEALAQVIALRPDIAVLDVMMPGKSGTEVLRAVREHADVAKTCVILLTAKAQEADVASGFALGADDYVVKPFSLRELLSRVQAVLGRRVLRPPTPPSLSRGWRWPRSASCSGWRSCCAAGDATEPDGATSLWSSRFGRCWWVWSSMAPPTRLRSNESSVPTGDSGAPWSRTSSR